MEQLTRDLCGVAVNMFECWSVATMQKSILRISGNCSDISMRGDYTSTWRRESSVEYLVHTLPKDGLAKWSKVNAVLRMRSPTDVGTLTSFMGSVEFYAEFLPPNLSTITEPLHKLTRKGQQWNWGREEQEAFEKLEDLLCTDAGPVSGIGHHLFCIGSGNWCCSFHSYCDGRKRPTANVSFGSLTSHCWNKQGGSEGDGSDKEMRPILKVEPLFPVQNCQIHRSPQSSSNNEPLL